MSRRGGCMMYFIANRCKINQRYFCPVVPASFSSFLHLPGNRRVLSLPLFSSLSLTLSRFPAAFRALLLLPSCAFVSLRGGAVFVVHWPRSRFQNYIVQCSTPAPIFPLCRPLYSFTSFYARVWFELQGSTGMLIRKVFWLGIMLDNGAGVSMQRSSIFYVFLFSFFWEDGWDSHSNLRFVW